MLNDLFLIDEVTPVNDGVRLTGILYHKGWTLASLFDGMHEEDIPEDKAINVFLESDIVLVAETDFAVFVLDLQSMRYRKLSKDISDNTIEGKETQDERL